MFVRIARVSSAVTRGVAREKIAAELQTQESDETLAG
jgi:hypothetical protein